MSKTAARRTFRNRVLPWWYWRRHADRFDRIGGGAGPPPNTEPSSTVAPSTPTGTAMVGQTLVSDNVGTWNGTLPITYTRQWFRSSPDADIAGATGSTYTLQAADVGKTVSVRVTATNAFGANSAVSGASGTVIAIPVAPTNTVLPATPTGTLNAGNTLTSPDTGTWTGTPTITYARQWLNSPPDTNIAGATGATYLLASGDIGKTIAVKVTATNAIGSTTATSAATGTIGAVPVPVNTVLPGTPTGTAKVGQVLTSPDTGTWTGPGPITYVRQWYSTAPNTDISGATGTTYTVTTAELGKTIAVRVTATNSFGNASASSAFTGTVVAADTPPVNTVAPGTPTGILETGQTLTSPDTGTWTGTATITFARQWFRMPSTDIAGATGATYTLVSADLGQTIAVRVTGTNAAGSSSASSAATGTIAAPLTAPVNTVLPGTPTGTVTAGQTLTSPNTGTWTGTTPLSYTYQWVTLSPTTDIPGATASTYVVSINELGKTIAVRVTASNIVGSASALSAATAAATSVPFNTVLPATPTGLAETGQVLTSPNTGTWIGSPTITFTRQWFRSTFDTDTDIAGATGTTYTLTSAEIGKTVAVRVFATNSIGTVSAFSAGTAVVVAAATPPVNTVAPATVTGTAVTGNTLTSPDTGTWTGTAPITYARQWFRSAPNTDIAGQTGPTYLLVTADVGKTVAVRVTATNAVSAVSANSGASATVTAAPQAPINTVLPAAPTGTTSVGSTLTSPDTGTWTGDATITYARQWYRADPVLDGLGVQVTDGLGNRVFVNSEDISGATSSTYVLVSADANKVHGVRVTATNSVGSGSAVGIANAAVPADTTAPTITSSATLSVAESAAFTHTLTANETVTWSKSGGADQALFTLTGATLEMIARDFEAPADSNADNAYIVQVTATDLATNSTNQTITVTVTNVTERVISITTGPGYVGSTYTSTVAGQWTADGTNISGQTGTTYVMELANEGKAIRCADSNTIEMWIPSDLGSLLINWWDCYTGLTFGTGSSVADWADRMGGGSMVQATAAKQPTYNATGLPVVSKPAVMFVRANAQRMAKTGGSNLAQPTFRIAVGSNTNVSANCQLFDTATTTQSTLYVNTSNNLTASAGTGVTNGANTTNTPFIHGAYFSGTSSFFRTNGTQSANVSLGTNSSRILYLGSILSDANHWNGAISELLSCGNVTSSTDFARIDGYLAHRHGLTGNLPGGHTYKTLPPFI